MSDESKDVRIRASGYENIYFDCPSCRKENILNRLTDIGNDMPISRMEGVLCQNNKCKQVVTLLGDSVNAAKYRWFFDELYVFVARKEYRSYILSLCQGIEAFFYQAVINKKFDRNPVFRDGEGGLLLAQYNAARKRYETAIKTYAFNKMRKEFLDTFIDERENYVPAHLKMRHDKRDFAFGTVERSTVHILRNKVAHKLAYRPTWREIEPFNSELVEAIYWLGIYLDIEDSVMAINRRYLPDRMA
ncbi:MAG TPA: hypothetical protein VKQ34_02780 [Candidatus Saccharimonadales bacterium]|nr:hypothetical protein [Candidatus Saccharimonadales bacterium]